MTLLFTPEELVRYLYNEASPATTAAIEEALQNDWTLREKLEVLRQSSRELNRVALESPGPASLKRIMNYARESVGEPIQQH